MVGKLHFRQLELVFEITINLLISEDQIRGLLYIKPCYACQSLKWQLRYLSNVTTPPTLSICYLDYYVDYCITLEVLVPAGAAPVSVSPLCTIYDHACSFTISLF